jgi:hypothetical protein
MMKFRKALVVALSLVCAPGLAAQKTPAQIKTDTAVRYVPNGTRAITATNINGSFTDVADSFGALLTSNTWTQTQTFTQFPIFSAGSNCYLKANGASALTCEPSVIAAAPAAPTVSVRGGVLANTRPANHYVAGVSTVDGSLTFVRPSAADVTGLSPSATIDATVSTNILHTAPGGSALPLDRILDQRTPEMFGASGSVLTSTCATTAGNANVTLGAGHDFRVGQHLRCNGAGGTYTAQPSDLAASVVGATGSTSRWYSARCLSNAGGAGATIAALEVPNGPTTLTFLNHIFVTWLPPAGGPCPAYGFYRGTNSSNGTLIGVTNSTSFRDFGNTRAVGVTWVPTTQGAPAQREWHLSRINTLAGNVATLAAAPAVTGSGLLAFHDDTAALNLMFSATGQNGRYLLRNPYNVTDTVNVATLSLIDGVGAGSNTSSDFGVVSSSRIICHSCLDRFILDVGRQAGANAFFSGGYLRNLALIGNGVSLGALNVGNVRRGTFEAIYAEGVTYGAFRLFNFPAGVHPPFFNRFISLNADLRARNNSEAHGLIIDGHGSGNTLHEFENLSITHQAGHCIYQPGGGDAFMFYKNHCYRFFSANPVTNAANKETGFSYYLDPRPDVVSGNHQWIYGVHAGGFYIEKDCLGCVVYAMDGGNMDPDFSAEPITGPGAFDVSGTSKLGTTYGRSRFGGGLNVSLSSDDMADPSLAASTVTTSSGRRWNMVQTGSGTVVASTSALDPGTTLRAPATTNAEVGIGSPGNVAYGMRIGQLPAVQMTVSVSTQAATVQRFGLMNTVGATVTDGAYVEYDQALGTFYSLVTKRDGAETRTPLCFGPTVTTCPSSNPPAITRGRWEVKCNSVACAFEVLPQDSILTRSSAAERWVKLGVHTTHIPPANDQRGDTTAYRLQVGAYIRTLTATLVQMILENVQWVRYCEGC